MEQEFTDWMLDKGYRTSYWPSTDMEDLIAWYRQDTGNALSLDWVARLFANYGCEIEGTKVALWLQA